MYTFLSFINMLTLYYKCAIPVFEGLLPKKHDEIVRTLLFELSTWHGLAKLRLHTESTVINLENSITRLGEILRKFSESLCPAYATYEFHYQISLNTRQRVHLLQWLKTNEKDPALRVRIFLVY